MTHIQQRRDQAAVWASVNPVLYDGEVGHEEDTGRWKMGDGVTAWNALPYKGGVDSVAGKTGEVTLEVADVSGAAPLESPALTGNPTAPTPTTADDDESVATTGFVKAQGYATVDSPAFTGNPTAPDPITVSSHPDYEPTQVATVGSVVDHVDFVGDQATMIEGWRDWTLTVGNVTLGNAIVEARYTKRNKTTHFELDIQCGTTSSGGTNIWLELPNAPANPDGLVFYGNRQDASYSALYALTRVSTGPAPDYMPRYHLREVKVGGSGGTGLILADITIAAGTAGGRFRFSGSYEAALSTLP